MNDLDLRIRELGDAVHTPYVPLAEDLSRGRAGVRRRRASVTGATLAMAAILVGGWALVAGGGQPSSSDEAGTAGSSTGTSGDTSPPATGSDLSGMPEERWEAPSWDHVLAGHLDPFYEHMLGMGTVDLGTGKEGWSSVSTEVGWGAAGDPGLGVVRLSVAATASRAPLDSPCVTGRLRCTEQPAPAGAERLLVGRDDGVVAVVVDREDGDTVALTFDPLFADMSQVPVSDPGPSVKAMVAVALDEEISSHGRGLTRNVG